MVEEGAAGAVRIRVRQTWPSMLSVAMQVCSEREGLWPREGVSIRQQQRGSSSARSVSVTSVSTAKPASPTRPTHKQADITKTSCHSILVYKKHHKKYQTGFRELSRGYFKYFHRSTDSAGS